jgi:hypothetical protein
MRDWSVKETGRNEALNSVSAFPAFADYLIFSRDIGLVARISRLWDYCSPVASFPAPLPLLFRPFLR